MAWKAVCSNCLWESKLSDTRVVATSFANEHREDFNSICDDAIKKIDLIWVNDEFLIPGMKKSNEKIKEQ